MLPFQYLILLPAIVATDAKSFCKGDKKPKVSVASSTQLKVSWEDAFKDCDENQIVATNVHLGNKIIVVPKLNLGKKEAVVVASPCLRHVVKVSLHVKGPSGRVDIKWSRPSFYNADLKIGNIYSGLLQEICAGDKRGSTNVEIPDGIKDCVLKDRIRRDGAHGFVIPISKPSGGRGESAITVDCKKLNEQGQRVRFGNPRTENLDQEKSSDNTVLVVIIVCLSAILVFGITVIIVRVCFRRWRDKRMVKQDVNVNYDTADYYYDYDTMDNTDSTRRRPVRMEVVDKNSVYGQQSVEGWEGSAVVDNNPEYGK